MPGYPVERAAYPTCTFPSSGSQSLGLEGRGAQTFGCVLPPYRVESEVMGRRNTEACGVLLSRRSQRHPASAGFVGTGSWVFALSLHGVKTKARGHHALLARNTHARENTMETDLTVPQLQEELQLKLSFPQTSESINTETQI